MCDTNSVQLCVKLLYELLFSGDDLLLNIDLLLFVDEDITINKDVIKKEVLPWLWSFSACFG